jgi:class 3 adenylate cyclase
MTLNLQTFLFTDLENSAPLWENFPDEMRQASARHDQLLRTIIETHGGRVIKTTGDGFHAVFELPRDGVSASLAGQRAMDAEPWPETIGPLKVRIGFAHGRRGGKGGRLLWCRR